MFRTFEKMITVWIAVFRLLLSSMLNSLASVTEARAISLRFPDAMRIRKAGLCGERILSLRRTLKIVFSSAFYFYMQTGSSVVHLISVFNQK